MSKDSTSLASSLSSIMLCQQGGCLRSPPAPLASTELMSLPLGQCSPGLTGFGLHCYPKMQASLSSRKALYIDCFVCLSVKIPEGKQLSCLTGAAGSTLRSRKKDYAHCVPVATHQLSRAESMCAYSGGQLRGMQIPLQAQVLASSNCAVLMGCCTIELLLVFAVG